MRNSRHNSLPQLAAVLAGFSITILLLESEALQHWAQGLEVSNAANVAVQVTGRLHRVLQPLQLEWMRRAALADLDRLGWSDDPARLESAQRAYAAAVPGRVGPCTSITAAGHMPVPGPSPATATRVPIAHTTPTLTALPPLPPVTKGQPRVLALAGDSMMAVGLSDILLRETAGDANVRVIKAFRSGTGLARPDVFDWMQEYPAMIGSEHPDAVIVAIGANDGQSFIENGKVLAFGSDAWVQVYQDRIAAFLNLLTKDGATVVWVGLPPMKSSQYNEKAEEINRIAYSVVSQYPHAAWWNPVPFVGDKAGAYREFVTAPNGRTTRLRAPDGTHFSDDGATLLSPPLIEWLNAPPPATVSQVAPPGSPIVPVRRGSKAKTHHPKRYS